MAVQEMNDVLVGEPIILPKAGWDFYLARWISHIGSPPLLLTAVMLLAAVKADGAWRDTAVYLSLALLLPIAYIAYLVQQGKATDFDVSVRRERVVPMFVSLAGAGLGWLLLWLKAAPDLLITLAAANLVISTVLALVTLFWKISVHSATAAASAMISWVLLSSPLFFLGIPLIIWSRVRLRRHTLGQTLAGALLSVIVLLLFIATV